MAKQTSGKPTIQPIKPANKQSTKDRIKEVAINLFNRYGYAAVSLYNIAMEMEITRGNLTYHYKTKEILLEEIGDEMWEKILRERQKTRQLPSFENLHNEVQLYYRYQQKYAFIFLDRHVQTLPVMNKRFRQMINQTIEDNKAAIAFAITAGNMKPEPIKGIYNNIAFNVWMLAFFWSAQEIIRKTQSTHMAETMIWSMLLPHFTKKGVKAFTTFFGKDYLDELGEPFDADLQHIVAF